MSAHDALEKGDLPVTSMLLLRGMIQLTLRLLVTFAVLRRTCVFALTPYIARMVTLRGVLGSLVLVLHLGSLCHIPLAVSSTIFFLST